MSPYPKSPAWKVFFARNTSDTFAAPMPRQAMPQPMSTASSARERMTTRKPSPRSRQCPRVSAVSLCSMREGMRAMRKAETMKETPLIQYAACGPADAVSRPPRTGPTAQLTFSIDCRSALAAGSSSSDTRFGMPA